MDSTQDAKKNRPLSQRLQRIALLALTILTVLLIIWIPVSTMISDARHSEELQQLQEQSVSVLDGRTRLLLRVLAHALQPGLTEASSQRNIGKLRTHILALRKETEIRLVTVADAPGNILVSTDSRLEGTPLPDTFALLTSTLTEVLIDTVQTDVYRVILPLASNGIRIGTAIIEADVHYR